MIVLPYLISPMLVLTTVFAIPIPESTSSEDTTIEPIDPTTKSNSPKSRQLLIAYIDPSAMSSPLRTKQEFVEEDPNSHVEIFHEDGEILQPAENIIFRPLFSYKALQAKRNRNSERRASNAKRDSTTRRPRVEENTIRRRSDFYSYRPEEIPNYNYRPLYYYYNGQYYPYY